MSVTVVFQCSGCFAEPEPVRAKVMTKGLFSAAAGVTRDGWVVRHKPSIESLAPDGWVPFDPYTGLCYCPTCWASIEVDDHPTPAKRSGADNPDSSIREERAS